MKPDWKGAPKQAKYLAQDVDGSWWWYENEPDVDHNGWYASGGIWRASLTPNRRYQETLEERPE